MMDRPAPGPIDPYPDHLGTSTGPVLALQAHWIATDGAREIKPSSAQKNGRKLIFMPMSIKLFCLDGQPNFSLEFCNEVNVLVLRKMYFYEISYLPRLFIEN